jgi:hypothetical protein
MPNGSAYPIIYVLGFAGGTSGIDTAADDPFYGFNDDATHVRVGGDGNPQFYQFEGPLLTFTIPLPPAGQQLLGPRAAIVLNLELLT